MVQTNLRCPWCKSSTLAQIGFSEEATRIIPEGPVIVRVPGRRVLFHCNNCGREEYAHMKP